MTQTTASTDRLLRLPEVQSSVGLCRAMIYRAVASGSFPRPVKLGRVSAWPESEVRRWIEDRKAARSVA